MNAVKNDIEKLVEKELAAANEKFPQFHSAHEGYAVILEEVEELETEIEAAKTYAAALWDLIKANTTEDLAYCISGVRECAICAACEAIQVAAMCDKFVRLNSQETE